MAVTQPMYYCFINTNIPVEKGDLYLGTNFGLSYKYNNVKYDAEVSNTTEAGFRFSLNFNNVGDYGVSAFGSFVSYNPFTDEDTENWQLYIMSPSENIQNVESITEVFCGPGTYVVDYGLVDVVEMLLNS